MHLVTPTKRHKNTYIEMLNELSKDGYGVKMDIANISMFFGQHVKELRDKKVSVKEGRVPESVYWLIKQKECIGVIRIRHELNENLIKIGGHIGYVIRPTKRKLGYGSEMLKLALVKCKKMNLSKVLITCDPSNKGSAGVIKNNGGIFDNEIIAVLDGESRKTARYWIEIK